MSTETGPGGEEATRAHRAARWRAARRSEAAAHDPVDLTRPVAFTVLLAILLAALPTLVIDPRDADGAAWFVGTAGIAALAVAAVCELVMRTLARPRRLTSRFAWWVLVLPFGVVVAGIPGMAAAPDYFDPFAETLGASALLVLAGMLAGPLVWFFVVFPVVHIVLAVIDAVRGRAPWGRAVGPALTLLPLTAIIAVGGISLRDLGVGAAARAQLLLAFLGIPGSYEVVWPLGLWILRVLVVALVAFWIIASRRRRAST